MRPPAVIIVVNTSRVIVPVSGGLQMQRQFLRVSSRGFNLHLLRERTSCRSRIVIIARLSDGRVDLSLAVVGNK